MSTSAKLTTFRLIFICRTTVKILIDIKYVKNAYHLTIVRNSERARKKSQQTSKRIHFEYLVYN